ncbi:hypothetical protein UO65_0667 [Actinokineospora spheciospongiae]|uniref:Uncharacterized protein n=1 Tax=Actinokineospora spheciospongiae TaxID=909613 RepID=W7J4P3_9PSEU|nr:hypothetical protein [Actinokineospora spheciospongiae]EWC63956.1 hypothetical protein UO65_0667 [Actinokineospora spheciospongiae]PWW59553.1 hypothetical protein DFQ13_108190 [Actinokineospora spheciospongiae]
MSDPARFPSADDQPFVPKGPPLTLPGEAAAVSPDTWYRCKADFLSNNGKTMIPGYLGPRSDWPSNVAFADYIVMYEDIDSACQFQLQEVDEQGWARWLIKKDGYHLDLKSTGWFYRASYYTTRFAVVDGMLLNDYWGGPACADFRGGVVPDGYYVGQDLGEAFRLKNCLLEPV